MNYFDKKILSDWPWWWSSGQYAPNYLDDLSSNPAEVYNFSVKLLSKKQK